MENSFLDYCYTFYCFHIFALTSCSIVALTKFIPGPSQLPVLLPRPRRCLRKWLRPPRSPGRSRGHGDVHGAAAWRPPTDRRVHCGRARLPPYRQVRGYGYRWHHRGGRWLPLLESTHHFCQSCPLHSCAVQYNRLTNVTSRPEGFSLLPEPSYLCCPYGCLYFNRAIILMAFYL